MHCNQLLGTFLCPEAIKHMTAYLKVRTKIFIKNVGMPLSRYILICLFYTFFELLHLLVRPIRLKRSSSFNAIFLALVEQGFFYKNYPTKLFLINVILLKIMCPIFVKIFKFISFSFNVLQANTQCSFRGFQ